MGILDDRLNSLTNNILAGDDPTDPAAQDALFISALPPDKARKYTDEKLNRDNIIALKAEYQKIVRSSEPRMEKLMALLAWRCDRILHNGKICNTLNGIISKSCSARKTCKRCAMKRLNERSFLEEVTNRNLSDLTKKELESIKHGKQ